MFLETWLTNGNTSPAVLLIWQNVPNFYGPLFHLWNTEHRSPSPSSLLRTVCPLKCLLNSISPGWFSLEHILYPAVRNTFFHWTNSSHEHSLCSTNRDNYNFFPFIFSCVNQIPVFCGPKCRGRMAKLQESPLHLVGGEKWGTMLPEKPPHPRCSPNRSHQKDTWTSILSNIYYPQYRRWLLAILH
jgi:hypothetical protein